MDAPTFDALIRRAVGLDRRSLLGLVTGALFASALQHAGACSPGQNCDGGGGGGGGNDDNGGKGGKGRGKNGKKKQKKEKREQRGCRERYSTCLTFFANYCSVNYAQDPDSYNTWLYLYDECSWYYRICEKAIGDACIAGVPY